MPVTTGALLAHYHIIAPLGAGGMGEVYRALDTRLDREVAIKVLPADFAKDADRLKRFQQEARATSALNHPNILTVHDIGTHENAPFIVAELLEGEELRAQLNGGALPVRRAIEYAQQIAAGLAAAHEKGIVHRDLKPENLFVTKDVRVKILDFGLAKLKPPKLNSSMDSEAPTQNLVQKPLTNPGVVMGTVGYMSPEQVRGQEADHRADIFAFGLILYEMLSGKRAFNGASVADVLSAILKEEPPELSETNTQISSTLDKIVRRCLEKKPEMRFHSAHDLGFALGTLTTPSGSQGATTTASSVVAARLSATTGGLFGNALFAWVTAAVALLAAFAFALAWWQRSPVEVRTVRSMIPLPENAREIGIPALSPDGRQLAARAQTADGRVLLWLREFDTTAWRVLAGTENAAYPFWSPDSRSIGFFADGKLKKIEAAGGPAITLCDSVRGDGGTWNQDGVIVFAPRGSGPLWRISAAGGIASVLTKQTNPADFHILPSFLPDGQHFLCYAGGELRVASLDAPEGRTLLSNVSNAMFSQGHLLYIRQDTLFAQPFDLRRLELTGDAFPVAEKVRLYNSPSAGFFSVSAQGMLVYATGSRYAERQLTWFERSGKQTGVLAAPDRFFGVRLSPDGKSVAAEIGGAEWGKELASDLWLYDVARGTRIRFTTDGKGNREAVWSPDGKRLIWAAASKTIRRDLFEKVVDGTGKGTPLVESDLSKSATSWSADGRFILYYVIHPQMKQDLWVLPLFGDRKPFPFMQTEFTEGRGQFSPDGGWVAYASDESRESEVYVTAFPTPSGKRRISTASGRFPRWQGKEIFYLSPDDKLMAVPVSFTGAELEIGTAQTLFEVKAFTEAGSPYDVTPDGRRFLFMMPLEQKETAPFTLVQNWMTGVKK